MKARPVQRHAARAAGSTEAPLARAARPFARQHVAARAPHRFGDIAVLPPERPSRTGENEDATPEPVIQRAIALDRLNVVGENHDESDPRRPRERGYTHRFVGANAGYWGEADFALGDRTDFGDPKRLRMVEILGRIGALLEPIARRAAARHLAGAITEEELRVYERALQTAADKYLDRLYREIQENIALVREGKGQLGMDRQAFVPWARQGLALRRDVKTRLEEIGPLTAATAGVIDYLDRLAQTSAAMIAYCDTSFQDVERRTITEARSLEMLSAAERGGNTLGIWKVGQTHADDLEIFHDGASPFALTSRQTFNTELEIDVEFMQMESDFAIEGLSRISRAVVERAGWDAWLRDRIAASELGPGCEAGFEAERRVLFHVLGKVERAEAFPEQMYARASRAARLAMDSDRRYRSLRSSLAELTSAAAPTAFIAEAAPIAADLRSRGLHLIAETATESTPSTGGGLLSGLGLGGGWGLGV